MKLFGRKQQTPVDSYWNDHTVGGKRLKLVQSAAEDVGYLQWRFDEHPKFQEFMGLWGDHKGEVVLDYGCGPGNDVVGFLLYSHPEKVIGADISKKALAMAEKRLQWHEIDRRRFDLLRIYDCTPLIPLQSNSVSYVHCAGCLQHTTTPLAILRELFRVSKPGARGRIMVYNRDSVWLHLYVAYVLQVLGGKYSGMTAFEAFRYSTDGEACPIARHYDPEEFVSLCNSAGFHASYLGGHLSNHEVSVYRDHIDGAATDPRVPRVHRDYLKSLTADAEGLPMYKGKYAGVGGVFEVIK